MKKLLIPILIIAVLVMGAVHYTGIQPSTGGLRIGDDTTNYAQFATDGTLTMAGTAKVLNEHVISANSIAGGASGVVLDGSMLPYIGYEFGIGDNMYANFEVPETYDDSTDLALRIYWYINEARDGNSQEVQWAIDWAACPVNETEAIDGPTHTGTVDFGDQTIPVTAKHFTRTAQGTIAAASLSSGDIIGLDINRVVLDAGNSPTAEPAIVRIEIEYTSDKLGE